MSRETFLWWGVRRSSITIQVGQADVEMKYTYTRCVKDLVAAI